MKALYRCALWYLAALDIGLLVTSYFAYGAEGLFWCLAGHIAIVLGALGSISRSEGAAEGIEKDNPA